MAGTAPARCWLPRCRSPLPSGVLPPVLPSAAARSTPALIRSRMVSLSNSARESSIWSMRRELGLSSPVSSLSARDRMLMPLSWKLLNGLQSLSEVPRQAVNPRDHNRVPGHKTPPSPSWRLGAVLAGNHPALSTRTPASLAVPSPPQNPVSFPPSITHLLLPLPALQASS